jgi:hypothetical protein
VSGGVGGLFTANYYYYGSSSGGVLILSPLLTAAPGGNGNTLIHGPEKRAGALLSCPWPHDAEVGDLTAALGVQPSRFRAWGVQLQAADQDSSWPISVLGAQLPPTHRSPQLTAKIKGAMSDD